MLSSRAQRLAFQKRRNSPVKEKNRTTPIHGWMVRVHLPAAEQAGQEEQARMEQRQPGQSQQDQAGGRDPVVQRGAPAV